MNLLQIALEQERQQWHMSQVVHLVGKRAFLKAYRGEVRLCLIGYPADVLIWWLDLQSCTWVKARDLDKQYARWAENAKIWHRMKKQKRQKGA